MKTPTLRKAGHVHQSQPPHLAEVSYDGVYKAQSEFLVSDLSPIAPGGKDTHLGSPL